MSSFSYSMQKGNEYAGKFPARHTRERTRLRTRRSAGTCGGHRPASARRKTAAHRVRRRNPSSLPVFFASFFVPLSFLFPRGRRAGRGFSCFFLRPPGESVFFRIKTGTAFRGGRIPERAFPANRFSLFQTHRLRPLPNQKSFRLGKTAKKAGKGGDRGLFGGRNLSAAGAKRRTKRKATKNDKSR